ncbi:ANK REP REGION domain-containing protein [Citrus sinensis]|uniref:ANK REP REGION domain-containing protein n=1 Tax=Citrus sinensis TaxID=2711 RepID=A0ACB8J826_CITSI|nr:ANK REP REGION domain-containing protein [Citrus sinensis]
MGQDENTKAQVQSNEGNNKTPKAKDEKIIKDIDSYKQVTRYILENDWKGLEDYIMSKTPNALTCIIVDQSSIFEFIVGIPDVPATLVDKLLSKVPRNCLQNFARDEGSEYMEYAVSTGKLNLITTLMGYNEELPNIKVEKKDDPNIKDEEKDDLLPVHMAAKAGKRDAVRHLLPKTREPLDGRQGFVLLKFLIDSNLFDMALALLKCHPMIARADIGIPIQEEYNPHPHPHSENVGGDLEKQLSVTSKIQLKKFFLQKIPSAFGSLRQKLKLVLWNNLMELAPSIKSIRDAKIIHEQTLEILRIMCAGAVDILNTHEEAQNVFKKPMFKAARLGIYEIVMGIMNSYFPWSLEFKNKDGYDIFKVAVEHRREKVFNIIFNFPNIYPFFLANIDEKGINILHIAARSVPSTEVPGAALQMQRELQWFKAVENFVHPTLQDQLNGEDKTPREVFTEEHEKLVEEGEKWMKDTAGSCSVVATLIMTIVFAAAITVPGGSDSRGMPNFLEEPSFTIFGISNALALFSSVISVLMFLGILTSRFSEEDFLVSLPRKLIIGLITLFFSIACLMVAFAATVHITQFHPWKWVIIPTALLGFLPVFLFATLQFPLLIEVFLSTYGPGIFHPMKFLRM